GRLVSPDGNQIVMIGDQAYQRLPATMESTKGLPSTIRIKKGEKLVLPKPPKGWKPTQVPLGSDAWMKLPLKRVTWNFSGTLSFAQDPQRELRAIRSANQVQEKGP